MKDTTPGIPKVNPTSVTKVPGAWINLAKKYQVNFVRSRNFHHLEKMRAIQSVRLHSGDPAYPTTLLIIVRYFGFIPHGIGIYGGMNRHIREYTGLLCAE